MKDVCNKLFICVYISYNHKFTWVMNSLGLGLAAVMAGGRMMHQNLSVIGVPFYRNAGVGAF